MENIVTAGKEREMSSVAKMTFFGYDHSPLNLSPIKSLSSAVERHLATTQGKTTLLVESANLNQEDALTQQKDIKEYGGILNHLVAADLSHRIRRRPTISEVQYHVDFMADMPLDEIINNKYISLGSLQDYFKYKELERLDSEHTFDIEFENHSKNLVRRVTDLRMARTQFEVDARTLWNKGALDGVIERRRKYYKNLSISNGIRDDDCIQQLTTRVEDLLKGEGGGLFLPFGRSHFTIAEGVRTALQDKKGFVGDQIIVGDPVIEDEIVQAFRDGSGENLPDDVFAQEMLYRGLLARLVNVAERLGILSRVCLRYEDISSILANIARSFSIEEIRDLCGPKVDLMGIIQAHQDFPKIDDLLSEE